MNERKPTEEDAKNILVQIRALRMYGWVQTLWVALVVEAILIPVLVVLLLGETS